MVMACVWPARESRSERRASHSIRAGSFSEATGGRSEAFGSGGLPARGLALRAALDRAGSRRAGRKVLVEGARGPQLGQGLERFHRVVRLVELGGDAHELADVLYAAVRLHGVLRLEGADEAGAVHDRVNHVGELACEVAARLDDARELRERRAHLRAQKARLGDCQLAGREERDALVGGELANLVDGGGAHAAPRRVDHAKRRHVVVRVHDELEVGHDVADLGAVEEARAAHDLVRHARAQEHVLEDARLGVGSVEDGHVVVARAAVVELLDLRADPAALVALVGGLEHADLLAVPRVGEQALGLAAGVVGHHGVGRRQDVARGAVVLLEAHHVGVRIVLLEV